MTTCYKATNSKDSLVYILRRIHGKWTWSCSEEDDQFFLSHLLFLSFSFSTCECEIHVSCRSVEKNQPLQPRQSQRGFHDEIIWR